MPSSPPTGEYLHVLDAFLWDRDGSETCEAVVLLDVAGHLVVRDARDASLSAAIRGQIAYHEVALGTLRHIHASELCVLALSHVEAAPPVPGINDPLYLHGTLSGPFVSPHAAPEQSAQGHLTLTRADLLDAFVHDAARAFLYAGDAAGRTPRCFHLTLAAERAEEIAAGRGIVLAYPLLEADVLFRDASNDAQLAQMLYDTLSPMCTDAGRDPSTIPVPSRRALEQNLVADGYRIEGDVAIRNAQGVLGSMLGKWVADRVALPREAVIDDYVPIAREALTLVSGYPSAQHRALRSRSHARIAAPVSPRVPVAPTAQPSATPQPSSFVRPPASYRPKPEGGEPEWMADFERGEAPRTRSRPATKRASEPPADPDWMDDFKKR